MSTTTCAAPQPPTERIPRSEWATHAHFPRQTLLLGSHDSFRRLSAWLARSAVERASQPTWRRVAASLFAQWQSAMQGGHERYEEGKLYPFLEARFGVSFDALEADHEELHRLAFIVEEALASGSDAAVAGAFAGYDEAMCRHLDAEEDLVIPLLLALDPAGFDRLVSQPLSVLLDDLACACAA